jgi:hypothetical protein
MAAKKVRKSQFKRSFRANHGEVDRLGDGQREHLLGARQVDRDASNGLSNPGVTGGCNHFDYVGIALKTPRQGMFASARAKHQDFHPTILARDLPEAVDESPGRMNGSQS